MKKKNKKDIPKGKYWKEHRDDTMPSIKFIINGRVPSPVEALRHILNSKKPGMDVDNEEEKESN